MDHKLEDPWVIITAEELKQQLALTLIRLRRELQPQGAIQFLNLLLPFFFLFRALQSFIFYLDLAD
jgi:hypothetical protein